MWFATWGGGLARYDPHGVQALIREDGLPSGTDSIAAAQGQIWMGSPTIGAGRWVARYDGQSLDLIDGQNGVLYCDSTDRLFLGGYGLMQYDGTNFRALDTGPAPIVISALGEDHRGQLLLGYSEGDRLEALLEHPWHIARYRDGRLEPLFSQENQGVLFVSSCSPTMACSASSPATTSTRSPLNSSTTRCPSQSKSNRPSQSHRCERANRRSNSGASVASVAPKSTTLAIQRPVSL